MRRPVVAIDGPAGAGKTTVTRLVSQRLGYPLVDTGALYRAVALAALRRDVDWNDENAMGRLSLELAQAQAIRFETSAHGDQRVVLQGEDISEAIRTQQIAQGASLVSAIAAVRQALLDLQRTAGAGGGVVLEGRDIGTVVFPDAEAKFFLTASAEVRARRRFEELLARGVDADLEQVQREVVERDRRDSTRPVAPLKKAPDALMVDSSDLSVAQVVEWIVSRVQQIEQRIHDEQDAGGEP
jgi:cytidylate kinase